MYINVRRSIFVLFYFGLYEIIVLLFPKLLCSETPLQKQEQNCIPSTVVICTMCSLIKVVNYTIEKILNIPMALGCNQLTQLISAGEVCCSYM
jgi:hypothetical protein